VSGAPPADGRLDSDTSLVEHAGGVLRGSVSERWRGGGGPHGGYLAALILRGLTMAVADESRAPQTLTVQFVREPKFGSAELHVKVERLGRSLTSLSARLMQGGEPVALALAMFAVQMSGLEFDDLPMPPVEGPWPDRRSLISEQAPPFAHNLVLQPRFGRPFQGRADPMIAGGWTGLLERRPLDAPALALLCDAWFSPPYVRLERFVPSPTVTFSVYFRARLDPIGVGHDELCLARFETQLVRDGSFERHGAIWAADGAVLAQSHQLQLLLA
jgi:acyl-coenzyme A thioesterase PaaI-like protein